MGGTWKGRDGIWGIFYINDLLTTDPLTVLNEFGTIPTGEKRFRNQISYALIKIKNVRHIVIERLN